jgi:peptide/nickel transport system permease protein
VSGVARALAVPLQLVRGQLAHLADSDLYYSWRASASVMAATLALAALAVLALLAPWIAPQYIYDPATNDIMMALSPPAWMAGGEWSMALGGDNQGRDVLSAILFGMRLSLAVGFGSIALAMVLGIAVGLVSGYVGRKTDLVLMRIADIQLSFPVLIVALFLDGAARGIFGPDHHASLAVPVLVLSIGLSFWPQFARTVRGQVLVEKNKEYVQAARVLGLRPGQIMLRHILRNVWGPVLVIATINLGNAVIIEATLSYLGVGLPPTSPSLGTLIRNGYAFLFSGEWWIAAFPAATLCALIVAVNVTGDWVRDVLNPKLR